MSAPPEFAGTIGRTLEESTPSFPAAHPLPSGSPNVVIILMDDTGFAHFGCYGSTIDTPNIDRLAAGGLRYNNFHTTALCSPTRAALLTGRNHHSVGMRGLSNWNSGFPSCTGRVARSAATLSEMLRDAGYTTFATGKWHLTPMDETSGAGPFEDWPLGRGFDRYYGFLQGETSQYNPELYCDNHPVDQPRSAEEGYHLSEDIIDQSIQMIRDQKSAVPERPFFLYCCFGATHSPHHAPKAYIDKYRGRFEQGWDQAREEWLARQLEMGIVPPDTQLAPRNRDVLPWDDLSADEKRLTIRHQEAFAGFLDHTDAQIGRLVDFLSEIGQLDDTLFLVLSDNGASPEGGPIGVLDDMKWFNQVPESLEESLARIDEIGDPTTSTNYPRGWAQAGNTPLKRYKHYTHGGGIRDPLIVHWPNGIKDGGSIRSQYHHVVDVVPTILEVLDVEAPATYRGVDQMPIHGVSMAYTFDSADAPTRKTVQYFEMFGNRGIWHDGWKAVSYHRRGAQFDDDRWELYHIDSDFSECRDLAEQEPKKLEEMIERWWTEAGRYGVLPLDERGGELFGMNSQPGSPRARRTYTFYPPVSHLNSDAAPALGSRSFTITADVEAGADASGVIVAYGSITSGLVLYVSAGRLTFDYNLHSRHYHVEADRPLSRKSNVVGVKFQRLDDEARATLVLNGEEVGSVDIGGVLRMISAQGMDIGRDPGSTVCDDYEGPFPFTGTIKKIVFDIPRRRRHDAEGEAVDAAVQLSQQ
jgi:arylsulfatase A-like enzyme